MLKSLLILILIAILAAIGAVAGFRILHWFIGAIFNFAVLVLAVIGILFLANKLRTK
jgi:hypothetical protein